MRLLFIIIIFFIYPYTAYAPCVAYSDTMARFFSEIKQSKYSKYWSIKQIRNVSHEIDITAKDSGLLVRTIIAMIKHESRFNPKQRSRNKNKSYDIGLTQQNSDWVKIRYRKVFKTRYNYWRLFDPVVSMKLMRQRLRECRMFTYEYKITCYNNGRKALLGNLSYYYKVKKEMTD